MRIRNFLLFDTFLKILKSESGRFSTFRFEWSGLIFWTCYNPYLDMNTVRFSSLITNNIS
jgi:hypothetical protein